MTVYYLDTSIWLDFHETRGVNGECALKLILKLITLNEIVLYSDLHIREFKNVGYSIDEINSIFRIMKPGNFRRVHIYDSQIVEAKKLATLRAVPKKDALHAVLARDNSAILISRDKHFERLIDVVEAKRPEDI